jgi:hypothetical protein
VTIGQILPYLLADLPGFLPTFRGCGIFPLGPAPRSVQRDINSRTTASAHANHPACPCAARHIVHMGEAGRAGPPCRSPA